MCYAYRKFCFFTGLNCCERYTYLKIWLENWLGDFMLVIKFVADLFSLYDWFCWEVYNTWLCVFTLYYKYRYMMKLLLDFDELWLRKMCRSYTFNWFDCWFECMYFFYSCWLGEYFCVHTGVIYMIDCMIFLWSIHERIAY